jgi:hypothetical protein
MVAYLGSLCKLPGSTPLRNSALNMINGFATSILGFAIIAHDYDYDAVQVHFEEGCKVIVLSHVSLNGDDTSELNHSSLLNNIDNNGFELWTAFQNGNTAILPPFDKAKWGDKKCHGLSVALRSYKA